MVPGLFRAGGGVGFGIAAEHRGARSDHDIVNGQKTWTTLGYYANRMFWLVRTDRQAKPQEGISFLLLDLDSPGVEVRPILTLDGEHEVNVVFPSSVRVPLAAPKTRAGRSPNTC